MTNREPALKDLKDALELACKAQSIPRILEGRELAMSLPRPWVVDNLEATAAEVLDLNDEWEYRRLLELVRDLDSGLLGRLVKRGRESSDSDLREAAAEFS